MSQTLNRLDYNPVIAKAWASGQFRKRLLRDPRAALASLGITPPDGVTVRVIADTPATCCLVLPPPPPPGVSIAEQLNSVPGGVPRAARLLSGFDRIVKAAWTDPAVKALLIASPEAAFRALEIVPPPGIVFTIVEDAADTATLVLPPPPPKEIEFEEEAGFVVNHAMRWLAMLSSPFAS
ncbi:MAG: NHLP leader peptide family RiPP precursor [Rhodospirillaceae bacterium]